MSYLEKRPWTVSRALSIVNQALEKRGVKYDSLDLLKFGTGAIYRIYPDDIVVRVTRPGVEPELVEKEERLRSWLEAEGFPVLLPASPGEGPMLIDESYVTFWQFAPPGDEKATLKDLAVLIKNLHRLGDETKRKVLYDSGIRTFNPFPAIDRFFVAVENDKRISWADLVLLKEWRDLLEERLRTEAKNPQYSELGLGLIHGDAHLGNCYISKSGPILLDFDFAAWGPREWDLVPAVLEPRRFGSDKSAYYEFAQSYGYDVLSWPGLETLVLIRELMITGWRLGIESSSVVTRESENRLMYWRRDPEPPLWRPF